MNQHPSVIVMSSMISEFYECPKASFSAFGADRIEIYRRVSRWRNLCISGNLASKRCFGIG